MNYSIGINNNIKIRVEDKENKILYNTKPKDPTKIISNHTTVREKEKNGAIDIIPIVDKKLLTQHRYKLNVITSTEEKNQEYNYLYEKKQNYDFTQPEVIIDTDGKIYFNSKLKNFIEDDSYRVIYTIRGFEKQPSINIVKDNKNILNFEGNTISIQDVNNIIMMLFGITNEFKNEQSQNIKIINKYSTLWGSTYSGYTYGPEGFSNTGFEKYKIFSNHISSSQLQNIFRITAVHNNFDIQLNYAGRAMEGDLDKPILDHDIEEIVAPEKHNLMKINTLGSLAFKNRIHNFIIPENYEYLGCRRGYFCRFGYKDGVIPFINIATTGTYNPDRTDFDSSWLPYGYAGRSTSVQRCVNRNKNFSIDNLIIKSPQLEIGHWYLAAAHINTILFDNVKENTEYKYSFEQECCGCCSDDYNYSSSFLQYTYINHIRLTNEDFHTNNTVIEKVGAYAFRRCSLNTFPFDSTKIDTPLGRGAFMECKFKNVSIDVLKLNDKLFKNNYYLTSLFINSEGMTELIPNGNLEKPVYLTETFYDCDLREIEGLENIVKMPQTSTFEKNYYLDLDFLNYKFEILGDRTFAQTGIAHLYSPTLKQIGDYCFSGCKIIDINAPLLDLTKPGAFSSNGVLERIINLKQPSLNIIPAYSFSHCPNLNVMNKNIAQNVTTIKKYAFWGTAVPFINPEYFPKLTTVEFNAFGNYVSNNSTSSQPHIDNKDGTIKEVTAILPNTLQSFYSGAFTSRNIKEVHGPEITDIISGADPDTEEEKYLYAIAPYADKLLLPKLKEISTQKYYDIRSLIIPYGLKECYLDIAKIISRGLSLKYTFFDKYLYGSGKFNEAYLPREKIYAPNLINNDGLNMRDYLEYSTTIYDWERLSFVTSIPINDVTKVTTTKKDYYMPKFWIACSIIGFYSTSTLLSRFNVGGNYRSRFYIAHSEKLEEINIGGMQGGVLKIFNCDVLRNINIGNNIYPLIDQDPKPFITDEPDNTNRIPLYLDYSIISLTRTPLLENVNFDATYNPFELRIDGVLEYTNNSLECFSCNYPVSKDEENRITTFNNYYFNADFSLLKKLSIRFIAEEDDGSMISAVINNIQPKEDFTLEILNINNLGTSYAFFRENMILNIDNPKIKEIYIQSHGGNVSLTNTININCNPDYVLFSNEGAVLNINSNIKKAFLYRGWKSETVCRNIDNLQLDGDTGLLSGSITLNKIKKLSNWQYNNIIVKADSIEEIEFKASSKTMDLTQIKDYSKLKKVRFLEIIDNKTLWNRDDIFRYIKWNIAKLNNCSFDEFTGFIAEFDGNIDTLINTPIYAKTTNGYYGVCDLYLTEPIMTPKIAKINNANISSTKAAPYGAPYGLFTNNGTDSQNKISHIYLPRDFYNDWIAQYSSYQRYRVIEYNTSTGEYVYDYEDPWIQPYD